MLGLFWQSCTLCEIDEWRDFLSTFGNRSENKQIYKYNDYDYFNNVKKKLKEV